MPPASTSASNAPAASSSAQASIPDASGQAAQGTQNPPPSSNDQSNQSNQSNGVNPLYIGAGAIGAAILAIVISVLVFVSKSKKAKSTSPAAAAIASKSDEMDSSETMQVMFEYQANLFDELTLNVGDQVQVSSKFDDGWALGFNVTTQQQGTFPLACIGPVGSRESIFTTASQSQRNSSLYAPSLNRYSNA